jgi:hypothetical protein
MARYENYRKMGLMGYSRWSSWCGRRKGLKMFCVERLVMVTSRGVWINDYTALTGIPKWLLYRQVSVRWPLWYTLDFVLYLTEVGTHVSGLPVWCNFCGALHIAFIQFSRILSENLTLKCSHTSPHRMHAHTHTHTAASPHLTFYILNVFLNSVTLTRNVRAPWRWSE